MEIQAWRSKVLKGIIYNKQPSTLLCMCMHRNMACMTAYWPIAFLQFIPLSRPEAK